MTQHSAAKGPGPWAAALWTTVALTLIAAPLPAQAVPRCGFAPPRTFPAKGAVIGRKFHLAVFMMPALGRDVKMLSKASLVLTNKAGTKVPLIPAGAQRSSPIGEHVLMFEAKSPLANGEWKVTGLPALSPFSTSLKGLKWTVAARKLPPSPVLKGAKATRSQCIRIDNNRVCVVALDRTTRREGLLQMELRHDGHAVATYVDYVPSGAELLLRNGPCKATFAGLEDGRYGANVRFIADDGTGSSAKIAFDLKSMDDFKPGDGKNPHGHGH